MYMYMYMCVYIYRERENIFIYICDCRYMFDKDMVESFYKYKVYFLLVILSLYIIHISYFWLLRKQQSHLLNFIWCWFSISTQTSQRALVGGWIPEISRAHQWVLSRKSFSSESDALFHRATLPLWQVYLKKLFFIDFGISKRI